jgi:hypothetical protein
MAIGFLRPDSFKHSEHYWFQRKQATRYPDVAGAESSWTDWSS